MKSLKTSIRSNTRIRVHDDPDDAATSYHLSTHPHEGSGGASCKDRFEVGSKRIGCRYWNIDIRLDLGFMKR